jgi:hypothetical protein
MSHILSASIAANGLQVTIVAGKISFAQGLAKGNDSPGYMVTVCVPIRITGLYQRKTVYTTHLSYNSAQNVNNNDRYTPIMEYRALYNIIRNKPRRTHYGRAFHSVASYEI